MPILAGDALGVRAVGALAIKVGTRSVDTREVRLLPRTPTVAALLGAVVVALPPAGAMASPLVAGGALASAPAADGVLASPAVAGGALASAPAADGVLASPALRTGGSTKLARLTSQLAAATDRAVSLSLELDGAAARDGGLRVALQRAQSSGEDAQRQLDQRARAVYMSQQIDPLGTWQVDLAAPDLRALAQRGQQAALEVDRSLIVAVAGQQAALRGLQAQATAFRARLLTQSAGVLAQQDRARVLLARAVVEAAATRAAAAVRQQLDVRRAALDAVSATVTLALTPPALTPAQAARTHASALTQAPVLTVLEAAGSGIPAGYAASGRTFAGTASWYGPGFVGRPTASGAPYDPEQLTCANKEVPLGTVLHVSANGRSVNCLVNDRGPYVGDRVLDLSRAGSRALGYDGLAQVFVEVLVPV